MIRNSYNNDNNNSDNKINHNFERLYIDAFNKNQKLQEKKMLKE